MDDADIMAALYAYGGGAPGQSEGATGGLPGPGPLASPTPNQLPSLAPAPVDPYMAPDQTAGNALINPATGNPEPVKLPPTHGEQPNYPGVAGPDTMSKGEQPQNPYGPAPKGSPPGMTDIQQGDADVNKAIGAEGDAKANALKAQDTAQSAKLDRQANNAMDYVKATGQADQSLVRAQLANNAAADAETAQWMQDQDKLAKKEPDPKRYWNNMNAFGKVMWILSVAFGADAQAHGAVKNAGLEMLDSEMNADLARQRDSLGRQMDALKARGTQMDKRHVRNAAMLTDIHAMKVQQLLSLKGALDLKAQKPGPADDAAAIAQAQDWVGGKLVEVAADKNKYIREAKQKNLDRQHEDWRQSRQLQMEQQKLNEESHFHDATIQKDYDLAQEKIDAKSGQQDAFHKSLVPIPMQSGAYLRGKDGKKIQLQVRGEDAQKVQQEISSAQQEGSALADLKDAINDSGFLDKVVGNDNQRRQAMAQVIDPMVKRMGGRFNKDTANALQDYIVGENTTSGWQRLTGDDKKKMADMVQGEMDKLPLKTKENLRSYASNLADYPDADFGFDFKSQRAPKQSELSGDQIYNSQHAHLTDDKSIEQLGPDVTSALPPPLRDSVTSTLAEFDNKRPGFATNRGIQELAKVRDYARAHPDQAKEADDAEALISHGMREAEAKSEDHWAGMLAGLSVKSSYGLHQLTSDDVKELAKDQGLGNIPTADIAALLKEFNSGPMSDSPMGNKGK